MRPTAVLPDSYWSASHIDRFDRCFSGMAFGQGAPLWEPREGITER